jgi:hypothetical protein
MSKDIDIIDHTLVLTEEELVQNATFLASKTIFEETLSIATVESNPLDAIEMGHESIQLFKKAEPHRGSDAGKIAGTVAGGVGGVAVATALVFPPAIPLVILGGYLGFRWGSKK